MPQTDTTDEEIDRAYAEGIDDGRAQVLQGIYTLDDEEIAAHPIVQRLLQERYMTAYNDANRHAEQVQDRLISDAFRYGYQSALEEIRE